MSQSDSIILYYERSYFDYQFILGLNKYRAIHYGITDLNHLTLGASLLNTNELVAKCGIYKEKSRVLDAGCGIGGTTSYLAKKYPTSTFIGISIVNDQISKAKDFSDLDNLEFDVQDYTKTSFKNSSLDLIYGIESICYAQQKESFIKEAYRLLDNDGRLVVIDGFSTDKMDVKKSIVNGLLHKWLLGWSVESLDSSRDFKEKMEKIGFKEIQDINLFWNVLPTSLWLFLWSLPGIPFSFFLEIFKVRNRTMTNNAISAFLQFPLLLVNAWQYRIIVGTKE